MISVLLLQMVTLILHSKDMICQKKHMTRSTILRSVAILPIRLSCSTDCIDTWMQRILVHTWNMKSILALKLAERVSFPTRPLSLMTKVLQCGGMKFRYLAHLVKLSPLKIRLVLLKYFRNPTLMSCLQALISCSFQKVIYKSPK